MLTTILVWIICVIIMLSLIGSIMMLGSLCAGLLRWLTSPPPEHRKRE